MNIINTTTIKQVNENEQISSAMFLYMEARQALDRLICQPHVSPDEYQNAFNKVAISRSSYATKYLLHKKPLAWGIVSTIHISTKYKAKVVVEIPYSTSSISVVILDINGADSPEEAIDNLVKKANIPYPLNCLNRSI